MYSRTTLQREGFGPRNLHQARESGQVIAIGKDARLRVIAGFQCRKSITMDMHMFSDNWSI